MSLLCAVGFGKDQDHKDGESCFLASITMILCKSEHATYVRRTLCEVIRPSFFACTLNFGKAAELFTKLMSSARIRQVRRAESIRLLPGPSPFHFLQTESY